MWSKSVNIVVLKTPEYSLSERLKFLRESRKLTQGAMAKLAGLSQATIAHIEKGTKDPNVETLNKISRALDIHIATLFATDDVFVFDMKRPLNWPRRMAWQRLEKSTNHLFKVVFERLDNLEEGLPSFPKERKKIGLSRKEN